MNTKNNLFRFLSLLILLIFLIPSAPLYATDTKMENYCIVPPYVKRDVSVNIMIIMDNSNDMNGRAYTSSYSSSTTYIGYFDPDGCYKYNISGHNNRWYRVADATSFTCSGSDQFSGNVLNWATMSRLSVLKRVLVGGNLRPQVSYTPDYIESEGGGWSATNNGCTYTVNTSSRLTTSGTCADILSSARLNIDINYAGPGTTNPYESVSGLLQELNDKNQDLNPDTNSPRTGLIDFGNSNVPRTNQCLPFQNTLQAFLNSIAQGITVTGAPLANAEKLAIDYYINPASGTGCPTKDPFLTCASWESSCTGAMPCRRSFILIVSTGSNVSNTADYPPYTPDPLCSTDTAFPGTSTLPLVKNACYGATTDLRNEASLEPSSQYVYTYIVHTFGSTSNQNTLKATALAGQGNYYSAGETNLEDTLRQAFQDILKRASAGTAASVLASGEGSGANLLQAIFYPRKKFYNSATSQYDEIMWPGRLSNMWYYVDPFFTDSTILDDSGTSPSDKILNLSNDKKVTLRFDPTTETTVADRYSFGSTTIIDTIPFESLINLWEASVELWKRDVTTGSASRDKRKIYTTINGTSLLSGNFSADSINSDSNNSGTLRPYLDLSTDDLDPVADGYADGDLDRDGDVDDTDASILIRYIHGEDSATINSTYTWLRSRTVAVDLNGDGDTSDTVSGVSESAKVWKLGDILNSTPKISSWIKLNSYDSVYSDTTYKDGTTGGFVNTSGYKGRGMVFTGGNDGMLHAFKLGMLEQEWEGQTTTQKARLTGTDLGKEIWAFIPKNVLPYLKYIKEPGYCHVYTVDFTPYIFDASIGDPLSGDVSDSTRLVSHWRTILIGGMRLGGACKNTCADSDCIQTPATNLGYSSYFALDITDQNNPTLLWEFSNENLGLTTTGPAVVRISARTDGNPDNNKNGHWFVVLASGPTGTVSTTDQQFLGRSNQNLRVFILNLKTGELVRTIDTGISNAFAGSMLNTTHDSDLDYQDDAIYIPYVKKAGDGTWTQGGVSRLLTKEDTDPSNWEWSKVIDDIGPVTSAVVRLQHKSKGILYLFFGTGRYYFEQSSTVDDGTNQRHLFGITEPCYDSNGSGSTSEIKGAFKSSCTSENRSMGQLSQVDLTSASGVSDDEGWYIALDTVSTGYRTERVITDPLSTTSGQVFFTTYKPYDDVCAYGGKSYIWAVKYDTGGSLGSLLRGKALLQTSTGSIEQIDLATAFTEKGGRRTSAIEGVPPTSQGLSLLTTPPPVKRIIHMRER